MIGRGHGQEMFGRDGGACLRRWRSDMALLVHLAFAIALRSMPVGLNWLAFG